MKLLMLFYISILLSAFSCKKDCPKPIIPPVIINDSALNIVWKIPIGYRALSSFTYIYSNLVIFSISENSTSFDDVIVGLDKTTGKEVWRANKSFYIPRYFCQLKNNLFFQSGSIVYAIDLTTGNIIWEAECPNNNMYRSWSLSLEAGSLWISWSFGDRYKGDSTIVYSIEPMTGVLKRINCWDSNQNDLYQIGFSPVKIWIHPNGDSILILNSISYNWNTNQTKADFIAWNMKIDTAYIDIRGYSGWDGLANPILIDDDVILTDQWQYVNSMNLKTFKTNWKTVLPELNHGSSFVFYNGMLMTTPSRSNAIAFINPSNGNIKININDVSSGVGGYHFKDNLVYFAGGFEISKVDLWVPKLAWKFESPDYGHGYEFNDHMALDAPNDLIYITDYGNFYCFKINK